MEEQSQRKLAVLIDADNTQPAIAEGLMSEIAKYGVASVKRIYGDWTVPQLKGWKEVLLELSIQPMQQFAYTKGKNSTDSAMIIDAMDLLYTRKFDGFCIVSSDSDFTRLAARIRESGITVFGFGQKKTPKAMVGACDKFIYTEILREESSKGQTQSATSESRVKPASTNELKQDSRLVNLLRNAVEDEADDGGWAHLGDVGQYIANQSPDFDSRNYGFAKLILLVKKTQLFDIEEENVKGRRGKDIYIRDKRNR